jgi:O-antigen/teichoic acid export membrane protein
VSEPSALTSARPDAPSPPAGRSPFIARVAGVFVTRVSQFVLGLAVSLALARLLGPDGRGQYAVAILLPGTLYALATFGLPSSTTFYSGRGRSLRSLRRVTLAMVAAASVWLVVLGLIAIPLLETNLLSAAPDSLLRLILIAIPFQFGAGLMGCILFGRQRVRGYNMVMVAQAGVLFVLVILLVGFLRLGVYGAVYAFLATTVGASVAVFLELSRAVAADEPSREPVHYRELLTYGMKLYPSVITSFFNFRADVFLLSWLLASDSQIGFYVVAVSLAEMTFYVPDSVSAIFFPRVAATTREDADASAAQVSRITLLLTVAVALAIIPAALVVFHTILPDYTASIPALLVLLPGVVSLSVSKVLAGYLTGSGKPLPVGVAATVAVVANIAVNIVVIPVWGIVGASAASLLSYSLNAVILVFFSSRASGHSPLDFVVPRPADVRRLTGLALTYGRALVLRRSRPVA